MELVSSSSQLKSPRRLSSIKETAYECNVHPNTIRKHIDAGKIETVRIGRRVLISREAIEKFIADQTTTEIEEMPSECVFTEKR